MILLEERTREILEGKGYKVIDVSYMGTSYDDELSISIKFDFDGKHEMIMLDIPRNEIKTKWDFVNRAVELAINELGESHLSFREPTIIRTNNADLGLVTNEQEQDRVLLLEARVNRLLHTVQELEEGIIILRKRLNAHTCCSTIEATKLQYLKMEERTLKDGSPL